MGRASLPRTETRSGASRWLYELERSGVGIVQLDSELHVTGVNTFARCRLGLPDVLPVDLSVAQLLPEVAQAKVAFLVAQATHGDYESVPAAMIIHLPDQSLLMNLSRIGDASGGDLGFVIVFLDVTPMIDQGIEDGDPVDERSAVLADGHFLAKIPTSRRGRILLVDLEEIAFIRSDGHYTWVHTTDGSQFCNLTISELQGRLDPAQFMRVHRSYIVNVAFINEVVRDDGRMLLRIKGNLPACVPVSRNSAGPLQERLGLSSPPHAPA
jgi:hypothetical protein